MSFWLSLLNDIAVSLFGSVLSASFCDALATRRNRRLFWSCMALLSMLQGVVYSIWSADFCDISILSVCIVLCFLCCGS